LVALVEQMPMQNSFILRFLFHPDIRRSNCQSPVSREATPD
jgi:hypothetical protein